MWYMFSTVFAMQWLLSQLQHRFPLSFAQVITVLPVAHAVELGGRQRWPKEIRLSKLDSPFLSLVCLYQGTKAYKFTLIYAYREKYFH